MLVVSDTTPITTLLKAGMEDLLHQLFGNIVIPRAVWVELAVFHSYIPPFVVPHEKELAMRLPQTGGLGAGEAEAITLAKGMNAQWLIIDDLKARRVAAALNIQCTGVLGLVVMAKRRGYISSVKSALETLETRGGLYLSDAVKSEALKLAAEV